VRGIQFDPIRWQGGDIQRPRASARDVSGNALLAVSSRRSATTATASTSSPDAIPARPPDPRRSHATTRSPRENEPVGAVVLRPWGPAPRRGPHPARVRPALARGGRARPRRRRGGSSSRRVASGRSRAPWRCVPPAWEACRRGKRQPLSLSTLSLSAERGRRRQRAQVPRALREADVARRRHHLQRAPSPPCATTTACGWSTATSGPRRRPASARSSAAPRWRSRASPGLVPASARLAHG
jgi:hypothetical protein